MGTEGLGTKGWETGIESFTIDWMMNKHACNIQTSGYFFQRGKTPTPQLFPYFPIFMLLYSHMVLDLSPFSVSWILPAALNPFRSVFAKNTASFKIFDGLRVTKSNGEFCLYLPVDSIWYSWWHWIPCNTSCSEGGLSVIWCFWFHGERGTKLKDHTGNFHGFHMGETDISFSHISLARTNLLCAQEEENKWDLLNRKRGLDSVTFQGVHVWGSKAVYGPSWNCICIWLWHMLYYKKVFKCSSQSELSSYLLLLIYGVRSLHLCPRTMLLQNSATLSVRSLFTAACRLSASS